MKTVSKRSSQIIYGVLLAVFYTAIVIFDRQTSVMSASEGKLTCNSTSLKTASSHFAYQTHLIDFNFRFIVIACVFETWRMRSICGLAITLLWVRKSLRASRTRAPRFPLGIPLGISPRPARLKLARACTPIDRRSTIRRMKPINLTLEVVSYGGGGRRGASPMSALSRRCS